MYNNVYGRLVFVRTQIILTAGEFDRMSIRKKLLISNFGMVFIPIFLFFVAAVLLLGLFQRDIAGISNYYGGGPGRESGGFSAIRNHFEQRDELFAGIRFFARYDTARLNDTAFWSKIDTELAAAKAGIVVVNRGVPAFTSKLLTDVDIGALEHSARNNSRHGPPGPFDAVVVAGKRYSVDRLPLTFPDGGSGTVYFLSDISPFMEVFPKVIPLLAASLLLILALTNGVLTFLVSRSFIKPLYALKEAAERIKEGDLDQELAVRRKDEFGQLAGAFEEMRLRLKHSIGMQLLYEENRKELLSNISHDLKTPIAAIKGCVEGILDGVADSPEKRDKYLRMIYKKATDMDRQIDELFLFSKLDLNRLPFHFERTELTAYLRDCAEELNLQPQSAGVTIAFVSDAENGRNVIVKADREKLRRVIQNIVDNSIKHMEREPKRIEIRLSANAAEAIVRIRDNGTGIAPDALPRIFDRFYRADPSRSGATGGSGLGLAIVKQIVEGHGGRVWAESAEGKGTTISFALPILTTTEGEQA
jgi:signal transduction histidine kinase